MEHSQVGDGRKQSRGSSESGARKRARHTVEQQQREQQEVQRRQAVETTWEGTGEKERGERSSKQRAERRRSGKQRADRRRSRESTAGSRGTQVQTQNISTQGRGKGNNRAEKRQ